MTAPQTSLLQPGGSFGAYRVLQSLGKGGMGEVYLVEDPARDNVRYAVKVLPRAAREEDADFLKRFVREAEFAMKVRHPNIVEVYDAGIDPESGLSYLTMEYLPGGTLKELIANVGPLPFPRVTTIATDIARALFLVQTNGLVHRDVKPGNILFAADGSAKLTDLGITRFTYGPDVNVTEKGGSLGTPAYMAPEQMLDAHAVDIRADLYSLGVVLFEMITGKRPNEGENAMRTLAKALDGQSFADVRTLRPDTPVYLAELVRLLTQPKREDRPASVRQVFDYLERPELLGGSAPSATISPAPAPAASTSIPAGGDAVTVNLAKLDVFHTGDHFHGYVIERLLGNGGLGAVYLVRHELLDTYYALKVLYPDVAKENASYVKRFLREAKIATRIRHPNLVAVHDCGFDEARSLYYLVMDYVKGGDLRQAIAFAGRFEPERAVEVVMQVASALEAAQKFQVVHRDIKPENIMVQPDGLVKLVDLGIAKAEGIRDSLNTSTETVFGTPSYVAPEQAVDAANVDTRADIYSLGVVLFEMIAGRPPFDGPNAPQILAQTLSEDPFPDIRDFNKDVDPMLAVLIRRMCVKERERRIANPTALLHEFEKLGYTCAHYAAAPTQYAPAADAAPTVKSMKDLLAALPKDLATPPHKPWWKRLLG